MNDTWEQEWLAQTDTDGRPNLIKSNTGIRLKAATYNVAEYCMKSSSGATKQHIWEKPEKLLAIRRWISETDADILMVTEDATYLDADGTKHGAKLLYNDRYPSWQGGWPRIRSRFPVIRPKKANGKELTLIEVKPPKNATPRSDGKSSSRYFAFGTAEIEGKTVLLFTVHPRNSYIPYDSNPKVGPVADRMNFLQIVFDLVYCLKDKRITDGICNLKNWDYVVIGGDFNTSNRNGYDPKTGKDYKAGEEDWNNLAKLRNHYRFDSANGGYLGWVTTFPDGKEALDNILVSGNVILESIKADSEWYPELYSDHVPLVTTMTLLDGKDATRFPDRTHEGKTVEKDLKQLRAWLKELLTGVIDHPCV